MILKAHKIGIVLLVVFLFISEVSYGQQDPMHTQYNFNTQTINPAYAGTWESIGFIALGRYQWVGFEGSPTTYTFSAQSLLRNENVGLGIDIISDKIGKEERLSFSADYSYRIQIDRKSYLRMGIKVGFTNYQNNLSAYAQYPGDLDPVSQGVVDSKITPNFGVGALLISDRYYIGLSVPRILEKDYDIEDSNYSIAAAQRHYFLIAGYVLPLSSSVDFKPTFLTKATVGAPVEFDFSANFLLKKKLWLGAMYRSNNSYGFITQWIVNRKMRIGYSYDISRSKLRSYNNGTHEIMLSYEIGFKKKWNSPRMF